MIFRKELESQLICVLFLKGKKKNPKCDFLFKKDMSTKTEFGSGGQVTY